MGRNSSIIALGLLLSRCSARGPPLADISYTLPEISWEILKSFVKSGNLLGNPEIFREIWKSKLGFILLGMRINLAVVLALLVDNACAKRRFPTWKSLRKLAGNRTLSRNPS